MALQRLKALRVARAAVNRSNAAWRVGQAGLSWNGAGPAQTAVTTV
jgi:hypothetical protein